MADHIPRIGCRCYYCRIVDVVMRSLYASVLDKWYARQLKGVGKVRMYTRSEQARLLESMVRVVRRERMRNAESRGE